MDMVELTEEALADLTWWAVVLGIAEIGLILLAVIWALTHAAKMPSPALLVVALVLVIMMLLIVFALSSDVRAAEVLALVGVPVGALVAASTTIYTAQREIELENRPPAVQEPVEDEGA